MNLTAQIQEDRNSPEDLERRYRDAERDGLGAEFAAAVANCLAADPDNVLLRAWQARLEADATGAAAARGADAGKVRHRWMQAVGLAAACGALFSLMAAGGPPVPAPDEAATLFWVGWAPVAAVALMAFLYRAGQAERLPVIALGAAGALAAGLVVLVTTGSRTDDTAALVALHLPMLAWGLVGATVVARRPDPGRQAYAYGVRSMETLIAGGIFLGSGMIFGALTLGIFEVFGIAFPETTLLRLGAFGIGLIPVLALASVYDPARTPVQQEPTGLARILRIMTWLALPAALAVMASYVVWFVPVYFWRAFDERAVLLVYNATIIAILMLLAAAVSDAGGRGELVRVSLLRRAALGLSVLTLLLNLYALAAIVSRLLEYGVTPNRHAVLGWNVATALMLVALIVTSWRSEPDDWLPRFRRTFGAVLILPMIWAAWVTLVLPLF